MGNTAAKEVVHQHFEHHNFDFSFELNSNHLFATGLLVSTKGTQSFGDCLAEGLLKSMKLLWLKQIGTTEWLGGQGFLSPPHGAIRIQQRILPCRTSNSRRRARIPIKLAGLVARFREHRLDNGRLASQQYRRQ